jgi:transcription antitermination factor NusG
MGALYPAVAGDAGFCWYATHVRVNQEKRVAAHLEGRSIPYFLPACESIRQWRDRRKRIDVPLFPGYLFVQISLQRSLDVLTVPNVVSLVGNKLSPTPIPEHEINALRVGMLLRRVAPVTELQVGQQVRILSGPFQGMKGVLVVKKNKRVALSIGVIHRSFLVDVDADEVEPLQAFDYMAARRNAGNAVFRSV